MTKERITRQEIEAYKREVLEQSVLVTVDDAARILAVSDSTVRRYVAEGRLAAYSGSGLRSKGTRILASELQAYVRSIRVSPEEWNE